MLDDLKNFMFLDSITCVIDKERVCLKNYKQLISFKILQRTHSILIDSK